MRNQKTEYFAPVKLCSFDFKEKVTSKKNKQTNKQQSVMPTFFPLLLLTYICMWEILYVSLERCSWRRRFYVLGGREGETVSRQETPSQCSRVDSPAVWTFVDNYSLHWFYVVTFGSYNNSLPYVTIKMMAAAQAWTKCRERDMTRKNEEIMTLVQMGYDEKFSA